MITRFIPHSVLSANLNVNTTRTLECIRQMTGSISAEYIRADMSMPFGGNNYNHVKLIDANCSWKKLEDLSNSFAVRPIW